MEYDFIFDRQSKQYRMRLSAEHEVIARFLLDEFGQRSAAYAPLLVQLQALKPYQRMSWIGQEFMLEVEQSEVSIRHLRLLDADNQGMAVEEQALFADDDLSLDEQGLTAHCGLEDFMMLVTHWCEFLAES